MAKETLSDGWPAQVDVRPTLHDVGEAIRQVPGKLGGVLIRLASPVQEAPDFMSNHYRGPQSAPEVVVDEGLA